MKIYAVTASGEVLKLKDNALGTRRRTVRIGDDEVTLTFGRRPVYLDRLPDEIRDDPHLEVTETTVQAVRDAGGTVQELKSERVQTPAASTASTSRKKSSKKKPSQSG